VPGGGVSPDGARWLPSRADFFVPVKSLSILFRARFRELLSRAGLLDQVDSTVWQRDWVVRRPPATAASPCGIWPHTSSASPSATTGSPPVTTAM
jgi:hypothetical protein